MIIAIAIPGFGPTWSAVLGIAAAGVIASALLAWSESRRPVRRARLTVAWGVVAGAGVAVCVGIPLLFASGCYPVGGCVAFSYPVPDGRIEHIARITLPDSARDVRAREVLGRDSYFAASFVIDRADVDSFIDRARFTGRWQPGAHAIGWWYFDEERGRALERAKQVLGLLEPDGPAARSVVIDLDRPDRAVVYLFTWRGLARAPRVNTSPQ